MVKKANIGFRLRNIDETRNYFLGALKHNDVMSGMYDKTLA